MKNTKRSFFAKIGLGIGFVIASLFSVAAAFLGFFLMARSTKSVIVMSIVGALALIAVAFGGAWLMTRSTKTAGIYAGIMFCLTAIFAWQYVYKPIPATVSLPQPTSATQYWQLSTGSRIAYIFHPAVGQAHPAPVIYLHGGPAVPTRNSNYEFFKQFTTDGFDVYLYDQIGTGLSSQSDDISEYTLERNVADLEAIRQQIGAEKVILVGTSWGSVLAAYYLEAHPDHVEKVVFMSTKQSDIAPPIAPKSTRLNKCRKQAANGGWLRPIDRFDQRTRCVIQFNRVFGSDHAQNMRDWSPMGTD